MKSCLLVAQFALPATLVAQTITVTATAVSPFTVTAAVATQVVSSTWPAGPLPAAVYLAPAIPAGPLGQAQTTFGFGVDQGLQPAVGLVALGSSSPLASASVATSFGPMDVLLQVQSSAPVTANLVVERVVTGTAGASIPMQRVDVGNDGTFEVTEFTFAGAGIPSLALGPQPLMVRVLFGAGTVGSQVIESRLRLRFVAENNLSIVPAISGCTADHLAVAPSFQGTGLDLYAQPMLTGDLTVGVIGLGIQPLVVSTVYPGCVLLPSADLLSLLPEFAVANLPIPANVRPATLWVQGVVLQLSGLGAWTGTFTTTQGYRVDAF
jgi:hypothetical protein